MEVERSPASLFHLQFRDRTPYLAFRVHIAHGVVQKASESAALRICRHAVFAQQNDSGKAANAETLSQVRRLQEEIDRLDASLSGISADLDIAAERLNDLEHTQRSLDRSLVLYIWSRTFIPQSHQSPYASNPKVVFFDKPMPCICR